MNTKLKMIAAIAAVIAAGNASASALGIVDPCVDAKKDFRSVSTAVYSQVDDAYEAALSATEVPEEFKKAWMAALREEIRKLFDDELAMQLAKSGVSDMEAAFESWFKAEVEAAGGELALLPKMLESYRESVKLAVDEASAQVAEQKKALEGDCKMDIGHQAIRISVNVATAPIRLIGRNLEGAKKESSVVNKALYASTGISVKNIKEHGLAGGKNSEVRKAGRAVAKVFGW